MKPGDKIVAKKGLHPHFNKSALGVITFVNLYDGVIHALVQSNNSDYKVEMKEMEFKEYFQVMDIRAITCPASLKNWMDATEQYLKDKS